VAFALWIDEAEGIAWAQGTHEYRPMGTAAIAVTDQFRARDFRQTRRRPARLRNFFAGFFGSLEEVNRHLRTRRVARASARSGGFSRRPRPTPAHLR
jgi:hypothetical protein